MQKRVKLLDFTEGIIWSLLKMQNSCSLVGMEARFLSLQVIGREFWAHTESTMAADILTFVKDIYQWFKKNCRYGVLLSQRPLCPRCKRSLSMLEIKGSWETAEIQGEISIGKNGWQVGTVCRWHPWGGWQVGSRGGGALLVERYA